MHWMQATLKITVEKDDDEPDTGRKLNSKAQEMFKEFGEYV
jgi:hypothetical protein